MLLSDLGNRPNLSIPAACGGRAEMKAAYRFFDNDKVTFEKVIEPHIARTKERMAEQKVVLLVQDTTEIDLTRPEQEVGVPANWMERVRAFCCTTMQAFTPEGAALGHGVGRGAQSNRGRLACAAAEKSRKRKQTPIEEKESLRWLTGLREARKMAQELPEVQCVCVADSEADIYELFAEPRGEQPVHWLIRACQDRAFRRSRAPAARRGTGHAGALRGRTVDSRPASQDRG